MGERPPQIDTANFWDNNVVNADLEVPDAELAESTARLEAPFESMTETPGSTEINLEKGKILILYDEYDKSKGIRKINNLIFKTEEKEISLFNIIPWNTTVCVQKEPDPEKQNGYVEPSRGNKNGEIFITGELNCPKMILVLLHEIGHIIDFGKLRTGETQQINDWRNEDERADEAEKIRRERVASAFALNAMRPYTTSNVLKKDAQNFLFSALSGYCKTAQEKIEKMKKRKERVEAMQKQHEKRIKDEEGEIEE